MHVDGTHTRWAVATAALLVVATGLYVLYASGSPNGPRGGSWPGLAYGIAGTALMLYAGAIGIRRRFPRLSFGRASTWLRGHLWLGMLAYPLILFHAGFELGGPLTTVLVVLFTIVVLTGVYGAAIGALLPRYLSVQVPLETVYDQLEAVVEQLVAEADAEVVAVSGPLSGEGEAAGEEPKRGRKAAPAKALPGSGRLRDFHLREVRPYLEGKADAAGSNLADASRRRTRFEQVRVLLPPPLHDTLVVLAEICEERRQLEQQRKLHGWLHGWLLVHLPAAAALVALTVVHAVMALYY